MKHLKDNEITYFKHMARAFTLAKFGFKIAFFSTIHSIVPCLFTDNAGKTIKEVHKLYVKMEKESNINFYRPNDKT